MTWKQQRLCVLQSAIALQYKHTKHKLLKAPNSKHLLLKCLKANDLAKLTKGWIFELWAQRHVAPGLRAAGAPVTLKHVPSGTMSEIAATPWRGLPVTKMANVFKGPA